MQPYRSSNRPLKVPKPQKRKPDRRRFPWWTLPVIAVTLCLLGGAYVVAADQLAAYEDFNARRAAVSADVFYGNVFIDDVSVAGLTMEEARGMLLSRQETDAQAFEITLIADGRSWRISSENTKISWNTETLLQQAYMVGRRGSLETRYQEVSSLTEPVYLYSAFTYDRDAVRQVVSTAAAELTQEATDATVAAFDVVNRSFVFTDGQPGSRIDADTLYRTVIDRLDNGLYGETITLQVEQIPPAITRAQLEANYTRLTSFTTKTTSDKNRNTNIALAAQALNGKLIEAGGSISFNETTGERTRDKGYQEAGAISGGRTITEVGGGVCQVSTTMFNALVRAGCEIVTRKPHAWPSDYVPRGEDATVDWPSLDVVLRNTSDTPMFLTAWYEDQTVTVEVYGFSLGAGVSIDLESVTTYERKPTEIVYTYNASLPVGTAPQLLRKPRTGYSVQTYKIHLQDGIEVSREAFYTSEYRMINEEYEYNDGNPPA